MSMKKVVITGATGAIGSALVSLLAENGVHVCVLCRSDSKRMANIADHPNVQIIPCDISQYNSLQADWSADAFFHLAWEGTVGNSRNDYNMQIRNVQYTLDAVHLAKRLGCHVFVGAGSQAEYGRVDGCLRPDTPAFPENGYGIAKLCAGQMSRLLCKDLGIRHVWGRILSVYGPYDGENSMIMSTINTLLRGETPKLTKGEQRWDYLFSQDAAKALLLMAEKGRDGAVYCIASGTATPLADYITKLRDCIDPQAPLGLGEIPYGSNQVMHLCADISDLYKDTGFIPQVPFEEGIQKTIAWCKRRNP